MSETYQVDINSLSELCGCASTSELVEAVKNSGNGQMFSSVQQQVLMGGRAANQELAWEAEALRQWFEKRKKRSEKADKDEKKPVTDVAVVSTASRPGPLDSQLRPKALLKIGDASLLTHCLRGLATAGIRHVVIVLGGPKATAIAENISALQWSKYFTTLRLVDLGLHYSSGHAASLLAAARLLLGPRQKPRPFLLVGVDHVYHHHLLERLLKERSEQPAGLVLVERSKRMIERLHLAAHSTAVRVALRKEVTTTEVIEAIGRDLDRYDAVEAGAFILMPIVFDALRQLARTAPYFTLSEALARFTPAGGSPSPQLRAISTDGLPWIAIETAEQHVEAAVAQSPLLRFLPRRSNRPGPEIRIVRGVAIPVQLKSASDRTGVFDVLDDQLDNNSAHPTIVELGTTPESLKQLEMGTREERHDHNVEETKMSLFQKRGVERKVSTGSLSRLLDAYDLPQSLDHMKQDPSLPKAILSVDHDREKAALGVFFVEHDIESYDRNTLDDTASDSTIRDDEAVEMSSLGGFSDSDQALVELSDDTRIVPAADEDNRHLLLQSSPRKRTRHDAPILPVTDVELIRLRLFEEDDNKTPTPYPASLAVRMERRVPVFGYLLVVVGCMGCAATSALERELPSAVTGPLRSLWRQSTTSIMYILFEVYIQVYRKGKFYCRSRKSNRVFHTKRSKGGEYTKVSTVASLPQIPSTPRSPLEYDRKWAMASNKGVPSKLRALPMRKISSMLLGVEVTDDMTNAIMHLILGFTIQNMGLLIAFLYLSTPVALVLVNSTPLWLVAHGIICTEKPASIVVLSGTAIACFGALVLCASELVHKDSESQSAGSPFVGIVFGTFGGIGGAMYVLAAKQARTVAPTRLLLLCNLSSSFLSLLVVLALNPEESGSLFNATSGLLGWLSPRNIFDSFCISLVVDGLGLPAILLALRYVNPVVVTVCLQLEPFLASVLDALLGENTLASMTLSTYIGTSILLFGCGAIAIFTATSKEDIDISAALKPMVDDGYDSISGDVNQKHPSRPDGNGYGAFGSVSNPLH